MTRAQIARERAALLLCCDGCRCGRLEQTKLGTGSPHRDNGGKRAAPAP